MEDKEKCKCGSCFTALKKIEGREDDVFVFRGNNEDDIKVFPDFIRRCVLFADNVDEYRIVQQKDGNIIIYINNDIEVKSKIINEFEKLAYEMKFKLPKIEFEKYTYNKTKKLKRVEKIV